MDMKLITRVVLLQCIWFTLVIQTTGGKENGAFSQIACHGDVITLRCQSDETIQITDAIYQIINKNTPHCRNGNQTSTSCQDQPLRERVSNLCGGKFECQLTQTIENVLNNECKPAMYLQVSYNCMKQTQAVPVGQTSTPAAKPPSSEPSSNSNGSSEDISVYFRLILFFMEMRTVPGYIKASPRKAALCLILSLAFGISLVIIYMLIVACCKRYGRHKRSDSVSDVARDEEDGGGVKALLKSPPVNTVEAQTQNASQPVHYETVLVTRQNGIPLSETTISSDSTLTTRKNKKNQGHAEVISTIKRTHSVDEGTQTDNEDTEEEQTRAPRTLSMQEAQELGDLVNGLNYYNSRIDDDDAFYPQFNGNHFQSKNEQHELTNHTSFEPPNARNRNHPNYYYANRGPSYDDEGRSSSNTSSSIADRQPLLTSDNKHIRQQPSNHYYNSSVRHNNRQTSERNKVSRNPSELSYTTSASNNSDSSLGNYSPEAIFNGDNLRCNSIQRTPKPGVRGDGFEFIVNSSSTGSR